MAARGGEETPDHPSLVHGSGYGSNPDGAGGGDRGDAGAVSDASSVLELLRPGNCDALVCGLGSRQEREVGACPGVPDSGIESEATPTPEGGVQGSCDDGDRAACGRPAPSRLRADAAVWDQATAGEAHTGSQDCGHGAVDVEAPGGLRPEATPSFAGPGVGPRTEAKGAGDASDVAARERFEGEHPFVSWSPGRDGKTRDEGYVPSECRPKRWPAKALSGAWRPRRSGGRNDCFALGGPHVRTSRRTNAGVTLTASFARSGAQRRRPLASATIARCGRPRGRQVRVFS